MFRTGCQRRSLSDLHDACPALSRTSHSVLRDTPEVSETPAWPIARADSTSGSGSLGRSALAVHRATRPADAEARVTDLRSAPSRDLLVPKTAENFEDLAPGRKHPSTLVLVFVHGQHEFHFGLCVFSFTGGGVDEAASATVLSGICSPGGLFRGPSIGPCTGLVQGRIHVIDFVIST